MIDDDDDLIGALIYAARGWDERWKMGRMKKEASLG